MDPKQFLPEMRDAEAFISHELQVRKEAFKNSVDHGAEKIVAIGEAAGLAARLRMCIERIEERS